MKAEIELLPGAKEYNNRILDALADASVSAMKAVGKLKDIKQRTTEGVSEWQEGDEIVREEPVIRASDVGLDVIEAMQDATFWPDNVTITPMRPKQNISTKVKVPLFVVPKNLSVTLPMKRRLHLTDIPQSVEFRPSVGISPTGVRFGLQSRRPIDDPDNQD